MVNIYQIFAKVYYLTINDHLPVLPGNEKDLCHENIVNIYLFWMVTASLPNLCQIFYTNFVETLFECTICTAILGKKETVMNGKFTFWVDTLAKYLKSKEEFAY